MICVKCGSTQFDEENGLFYCFYCQTQSQGFSQETEQTFLDISKYVGHELTKKRVKKVVKRRTGVLWTTTEAFNKILIKQMDNIYDFNSDLIDIKEFKDMTQLIWFTYLRKSGLAFTDDESCDTEEISRRLHPATRFRDFQILTNKVNECLPAFKNKSTELGFTNLFKLGSDGVVRTLEESKTFDDFECKLNEEQNDWEVFDVFFDRYRDPRKYTKTRIKSYGMKISNESRKQLSQILSQMDCEHKLFESTIDSSNYEKQFTDLDDSESESLKTEEEVVDKKEVLRDSPKSNNSNNSENSVEGKDYDYDKELLKNMPETTELFSKYIPLSYLKSSRNISTNYFIDLMSLPKTLSILNIVFRLLRYDIYCFDLIRWANEGHIPYTNCLTCFPEDWVLISNDFMTFTSSCVPSSYNIYRLSAHIAKHIKIDTFPKPNLSKLMYRFAKDLNLPKDIVYVIHTNYNLFENFSQLYNPKKIRSKIAVLPSYEKWVFMAIVLVLKRCFGLNDSTEKRLSRSTENDKNVFNWDEWESYTRLRVELIRSYFIPLYSGNLEDIRDVDLIVDHCLQRTETLPAFGDNKKNLFKHSEFRTDVQQEFNELLFDESEGQSFESINPSLYPLTNATDFALKRINSIEIKEKMSVSFENKMIRSWVCEHGKCFHRPYIKIKADPKEWSESFKLLMYLSSMVLNCRVDPLIKILKLMENKYFGK